MCTPCPVPLEMQTKREENLKRSVMIKLAFPTHLRSHCRLQAACTRPCQIDVRLRLSRDICYLAAGPTHKMAATDLSVLAQRTQARERRQRLPSLVCFSAAWRCNVAACVYVGYKYINVQIKAWVLIQARTTRSTKRWLSMQKGKKRHITLTEWQS